MRAVDSEMPIVRKGYVLASERLARKYDRGRRKETDFSKDLRDYSCQRPPNVTRVAIAGCSRGSRWMMETR